MQSNGVQSELAIVDRLIAETRDRTGSLIALLEELQAHFNYLPPPALERASEALGVSLSHIFGVATFYNAFSLQPRGRFVVRACLGTACHVAGGQKILDELSRALGVAPGETTPDGLFALDVVHCLGACAVAPVVVTGGEYHGRMDPPKARAALKRLQTEAGRDGDGRGQTEKPTSVSVEPDSRARRVGAPAELLAWRSELLAARPADRPCLSLCGGPGCRPRGGDKVAAAFRQALAERGLAGTIEFRQTGCMGFCEAGPVVVAQPDDVFYPGVKPEDAGDIVDATAERHALQRLLYVDPETGRQVQREGDVPFYARQTRLLLRDNKHLEPTSLDDAVAAGRYQGLLRAITSLTPEQVIEEVKASGLRGRGGAGFPTGSKWEFCRRAEGRPKVVICNADEGDPGAFMDRSILEGDPHSVIEGMAIGAYAIGASIGIVYVREEYPLAIEHLTRAVHDARAAGLLGDNVLGTEFCFDLEIVRGAGAFVCGEETALIASVEGERGMPRAKPPFPATHGLHGLPTNINNVKTWKFVQVLLHEGHEVISSVGTEKCRGTMLFALVGKVRHPGLVEVPLGTTIRELVFGVGGGPAERPIKAVQLGGPSGGCIPEALFDTPLTYEALAEVGGILGSGGVIVLDEGACMVDVARYFVQFTRNESCGKCVPCQMGTQQLKLILDRIVTGRGRLSDLEQLERICGTMKEGSLCGLGKTAPNPVLTTLRYFREEYLRHIEAGCCPPGVCRELVTFSIDEEACVGCSLCRKVCGSGAIVGEHRGKHFILTDKCAHCGACYEVCPPKVRAVLRRTGVDAEEVLVP